MSDIKQEHIVSYIKEGKDNLVIPLLYKKALPELKSYISLNKGNKEDTYDIFHDALMIFYDQVITNKFNEKYSVYGYLYRLCVFRWINKIKRDKLITLKDNMPDFVAYELKEDDTNNEFKDETLLNSLFSKIGEKCIELLNYTIYSKMLMEDIMLRMNFSSPESVRMQQMRCKQKLMKEIEQNPSLLKRLKK